LKSGKFWTIPEGPHDVEQLWQQGQPLDPARLPDWLGIEDIQDFRYLGYASSAGAAPAELDQYQAELDELELAGLILHEDPNDRDGRHLFIEVPRKEAVWAIGLYEGTSPVTWTPAADAANPVVTARDVTDVAASFVADPFMIQVEGTWHMFFEVWNWKACKGEIGLATSRDGLKWKYERIVLAEKFHVSYPYVFACPDGIYLIPESYQANAVRLYKARAFPTEWAFMGNVLTGRYFADPSVFRYHDRWWLFAETNKEKNNTLRLFHADNLQGPWLEHPRSPVIGQSPYKARPGGRVLVEPDRIIRYAQSCLPEYGMDVRAFAITELSVTKYREQPLEPSPVLAGSGVGWNARGMHHIDPHQLKDGRWLACVDGWR
jgi:hypothetical protein